MAGLSYVRRLRLVVAAILGVLDEVLATLQDLALQRAPHSSQPDDAFPVAPVEAVCTRLPERALRVHCGNRGRSCLSHSL